MDLQTVEFHKENYKGYKYIADVFPERVVSVDANQNIGKVVKETLKIIENLLEEKK